MKTLSIKSKLLHLMILSLTLLWSVVGVGQTTIYSENFNSGTAYFPADPSSSPWRTLKISGFDRSDGSSYNAWAPFYQPPGYPDQNLNMYVSSSDLVYNTSAPCNVVIYDNAIINATSYSYVELSFNWSAGGDAINDYLIPVYSLDAGATWNDVGVKLGAESGFPFESVSGLSLPVAGSNFKIGFRWVNDGTGGDGIGPVIDNIVIQGTNSVVSTTFYNSGSAEQLVFNNAYLNFQNPTFRLSSFYPLGNMNRYRIEINTQPDFSGTSFSQEFAGTYASNTEYDFLCNSLTPALPSTNGVTYYVRARASHDGGTNWGPWSSQLHSFTYRTDCPTEWYQTEYGQFDGNDIQGLKTNDAVNDFMDVDVTSALSIGNTILNGNSSLHDKGFAPGEIALMPITVDFNTDVTGIQIYFTALATFLDQVYWQGIYEQNGTILTLLSETGNVSIAGINFWQTANLLTPVTLVPGKTYYIAYRSRSSGNKIKVNINEDIGHIFGTGYPTMTRPNPIDLATEIGSSSLNGLNIALVGTAGGGLSTNNANTLVELSSFKDADSWDELSWSADENGGDVIVQVLYDNGTDLVLIPDVDLAGNSVGYTVAQSPLDISGLNTTTYGNIYLRVSMANGATVPGPRLYSWKVSVNKTQQPTPDGIDGTGPICFGTNATLTADDDPLDPGYDWAWYTGSCGGTLVGTGPSITVSPSVTTTYYLGIIDAAGCIVSDCVSGTVTLPTVGTTLAINNDVAVCLVNSNNFVHFYEPSGRLLASINSNGQNLGNVTMTAYVDGAPALVPACDDPTDPQYMTHVMQRHWVITPEFQPGADVIVRLPYDDNGAGGEYQTLRTAANANANDNDDIVDYASIVLSKYAGPANVNNSALDNCPASGGNGGTELFTQSSLSGQPVNSYLTGFQPTAKYADFDIPAFSEFWLHGSMNDSPLPVALTNFSGDCATSTSGRLIRWTTASEQNSSHFVVESSIDGVTWTAVETVDAAGNSNQENHYESLDRTAYAGMVYYRLAQVDNDGQTQVYGPIAVTCDEADQFVLYPNPATNELNILIPAKYTTEDFVVQLFNPEGRIILSESLNNSFSNKIEMDISAVAKGVYFIQGMTNDGVVYTDKLVKE